MSKDPNSYRVPILRLKDVAKEEDEAPEDIETQPKKKKKGLIGSIVASAKKEVSEDDIAAAVITPVPTGGKKPPKEDVPTGKPTTRAELEVEPIAPNPPAPEEEQPKIKEDIPTGKHDSRPVQTEEDSIITEQFTKKEAVPAKEEKTGEELGIEIPEGSVLSAQPQKVETSEPIVPSPAPPPETPTTSPPQTTPKSPPTPPQDILGQKNQASAIRGEVPLSPPLQVPDTPTEEKPITPPQEKVPAPSVEQQPQPITSPVTPTTPQSTPPVPEQVMQKPVPAPETEDEQPSLSTPMFEIDEEKSPIEDDTVDFGASSGGAPLDIWEKAETQEKQESEQEVPEVKHTSNIDPSATIGGGNKPVGEVVKQTPERPETPATPQSSNLASLRQRILNKTPSTGQGAQPSVPVGLGGTAPPPTPETATERPRPGSKHASALADVADKLGAISKTETPTSESTTPATEQPQQTITPQGENASEKGNITKKPEVPVSSVPLVRTFKADVEQAIMKNQTSVVDMMTAEQNKKQIDETVRRAPRGQVSTLSVLLMWVSAGLILLAMAVGTFLIFRFLTADRASDTPEIVPSNELQAHDITDKGSNQILQGLLKIRESNASPLGTITELQIIESRGGSGDSPAKTSIVKTHIFFERLNTHAPGSLIRATADDMTIGLHKLVDNEVFWAFKVEDYQNASRGMFEWEEYMRVDLSPLFGEYTPQRENTNSTSTSGSSIVIKEDFEDVTVANTAARGLRDTSGNYILLWSMPDRETVVIASSFETMETLIKRMQLRAD